MIPDLEHSQAEQRTIALARIVFELTQQFNEFTTTEEMFAAIADGATKQITYDRLAIVLYRNLGSEVELLYSRGEDLVFRRQVPVEMPLHERLFVRKQPFLHTIGEVPVFAGDVDRYEQGYRQAAVAPLIIDRENIGMLTLMSKTPDHYSDSDLWILSSLAGALGVMLAGSNLRHEAEARSREAEFLAEMSLIVSSVQSLNELLRRSVEQISIALDAPTAIYLMQDDLLKVGAVAATEVFDMQNVNIFVASIIEFGDNPVAFALARDPDDDPFVHHLGNAGESPINPVLAHELRLRDVTEVATVPIAWEGRNQAVLGTVRIAGKGNHPLIPPQRQPAMLKRLAQYLAPAIQHTLQYEELMRNLNESEVIRRILSDTSNREDTADGLDIMVRAAQLLFGADYVAIARLDQDRIHWVRRVGGQVPVGDGDELPVTMAFPELRRVIEKFAPIVIRDFPVDPPVKAEMYPIHLNEGLRSSLVAPFQIIGEGTGILMVGFRRPHHFDTATIRFARSLASGVAASLLRRPPD